MLKLILLFINIVLFAQPLWAQLKVQGKLLNKADGSPVAYANIGILNKNTGTISNSDGSFEIQLDSTFLGEILTFSALGYEQKTLEVRQLLQSGLTGIYLQENSLLLNEIVIQSDIKKIRTRRQEERGNFVHTAGTLRLDTARAGGAVALLIRKPATAAKLTRARLYIAQNSLPSFKVRVRFYEVEEESGLPGKDMVDESILISESFEKGWLEIDLLPYNIWVTNSEFFLTFEWIMDKDDRRRLAEELLTYLGEKPESLVSQTYLLDGEEITETRITGFKGGTWFGSTYAPGIVKRNVCYYRISSLGEWKRSPSVLSAGLKLISDR